MEGTNQEKLGGSNISNSISFNPPRIIQESPLKLPNLAPMISDDRRANTAVSGRRGSSIFSPTQTLDQPYNNNPPKLNPPTHNLEYPTPDSDPTHINNTISSTPQGGGVIASSSRTPAQIIPQSQNLPVPQESAKTTSSLIVRSTDKTDRYKECLKNHAANTGGHVLDGCGEFMPGGEEGTLEFLRCAACDCHRNFHRKEVEGEGAYSSRYNYSGDVNHDHNSHQKRKVSTFVHRNRIRESSQGTFVNTPPTMMNFGGGKMMGGNNVATESSSEDLNVFERSVRIQSGGSKKRFRTKFSQEQKDKMHEFASKLGWTIQRQDDQEVMRFCNEVGVKRQVFKVWMHNNKQAMKRKSSPDDQV